MSGDPIPETQLDVPVSLQKMCYSRWIMSCSAQIIPTKMSVIDDIFPVR